MLNQWMLLVEIKTELKLMSSTFKNENLMSEILY